MKQAGIVTTHCSLLFVYCRHYLSVSVAASTTGTGTAYTMIGISPGPIYAIIIVKSGTSKERKTRENEQNSIEQELCALALGGCVDKKEKK